MKLPLPTRLRPHFLPALFCLATLFPWLSTQRDDAQFSFHFRSTRYTVHSYEGRLTLAAPPSPFTPHINRWTDGIPDYTPPTTPQALAEAIRNASVIRNTDIWRFRDPTRATTKPALTGLAALFGDGGPEPDYPSPSIQVFYPIRYNPNDVRFRANFIALLSALEDPVRCVAAHRILWDYLRTEVISNPRIDSHGDLVHRWHDVLDQRIFSLWYGTLFLLAPTLPFLHLTRPRPGPHRLRRWAFNAAALLSCLAAISVLLASFAARDREFSVLQVLTKPRAPIPMEIRVFLDWNLGTVSLGAMQGREKNGEWAETHDIKIRRHSLLSDRSPSWVERIQDPYWDDNGRILRLPWPLVAVILTLLPAARLLQFIRHPHPRPGHCPVCHYNLRATPTRCPECGYTCGSLLPPQ